MASPLRGDCAFQALALNKTTREGIFLCTFSNFKKGGSFLAIAILSVHKKQKKNKKKINGDDLLVTKHNLGIT